MRLAVGLLAAAAMWAADLPVRQVILYKHGVGYFERAGTLAAGESARLDFKPSEMNDVLKSLTVEEKGGGKIRGLRYDSSLPLDQKLADFPFRIQPGQPLADILDQMKGARVEMKFGAETATGALVSGRAIPGDDKHPPRELITILVDGGELRTLDLGAATGIRFTDPALQAQFKDYLAALMTARSKEKRSVYIDSTDAGSRQVIAGYMVPMPVWKSSYRLIFAESQPTLEGWAIVDNTTGEDWTNVRLALVSGKPISFISRLYEPRFITRPGAELPEEMAQAPVLYQGGMEDAKVRAQMAAPAPPAPMAEMPANRLRAAAGFAAGAMQKREEKDANELVRSDAVSTVAAPAGTRELGELFEYRLPLPVTVRKNESAMLPFLQDKLEARKLLIYSDPGAAHPMNAAEITNSTGKTLDGGPITVYDTGAYGGEALMETLKNGDKRLISYAVDLGTRITTRFDTDSEVVREVHFNRGILTTRTAAVETRTYTVHNVDQKAKTLIVEHAARPAYKVLSPKPVERTTNAYRFELKLPAGGTEKLPVTEERVYENSYQVVSLTPDLLATFIRNKNITDAARQQLQLIAARKQQIAETGGEFERMQSQINEMVRDQDRIRQNINSLNQVSGQQQQVQLYAKQLAQQEGQLAAMRDQASQLRRKRVALESELNSLIEKTQF